ncbi:hypothetical protein IW147_000606 [Coemansia sp. RSA 720]|nr:hypothetical protein IW147_000606 [Coemansia sp. RSA 720]
MSSSFEESRAEPSHHFLFIEFTELDTAFALFTFSRFWFYAMFGFNSSSSGTTAFGGSSTGGFGGTSTGGFGSTNAGGFGSTATSAAAPSTSLFGNTAKPAATTSTGLFGSTATSAAAPSTGLFGSTNTSTAAPTTGLFGGTATSTAAPAGGLFGGTATSTAAPSTGLFGATSSAAAPSTGMFGGATTSTAPTTSLFGGATTSAAAPTTGLFGGAATSAAPTTSLFGSTTTSTAAPSSGLFGGSSTSAAAPSTSLFGSAPTSTAAPTTSLFGSSTTTATTAPTAGVPATTSGAQPALTRKTKFADLPADIQNVLTAVEKQKQVQIQIGNSIIAEETEKEVKEVSRTVQRLGQELEVVKMTLAGDQTRVEDAKTQAQFAVKHAEKAASLVAHATDDGSWAQSGLTPLQVANRQKTLLALQHDNGEATAASLLFNQADARESQGDKSVVADPYEAVRRIQFASMHQDVASEYYWAWLERVESSAQLLAERLDQLERHVSSAVTRAQSMDDGHKRSHESDKFRPSPKAVSDVIQHQNDSFLAIVSKVAALDDDIRKLKRKLGIK